MTQLKCPEVVVILGADEATQVLLDPAHPLPRVGESFHYGRGIYVVTSVIHAMDLPDYPQIIVSAVGREMHAREEAA